MRKFVTTFLVCSSIVGAAGCTTAATGVATAESSVLMRQLIVKFKADTFACDAAGIARLARQTGIALEYLRPMSGGACVIRHFSRDEAAFSSQQNLLRRHPAIESVEPDRLMKTL